MTKELSKQLCELCGIEGKWIKYETETTDGCINLGSKLVYPDFTKPENFVRLYELETGVGETVAGLMSRYYLAYDCPTFVEHVLKFCSVSEWDVEAVEAVMQSIGEAEWVYEN